MLTPTSLVQSGRLPFSLCFMLIHSTTILFVILFFYLTFFSFHYRQLRLCSLYLLEAFFFLLCRKQKNKMKIYVKEANNKIARVDSRSIIDSFYVLFFPLRNFVTLLTGHRYCSRNGFNDRRQTNGIWKIQAFDRVRFVNGEWKKKKKMWELKREFCLFLTRNKAISRYLGLKLILIDLLA